VQSLRVGVANTAKATLPIPQNLPPTTGCRLISEDSCSRDPVITSSVRTAMVVVQTTTSGPNSR
jgi:hypothetical protein